MLLRYVALPTDKVRALQNGGADAYGMKPERQVSDGHGVPCRHCLRTAAAGKDYLILAYRPFPELQPTPKPVRSSSVRKHASVRRRRT